MKDRKTDSEIKTELKRCRESNSLKQKNHDRRINRQRLATHDLKHKSICCSYTELKKKRKEKKVQMAGVLCYLADWEEVGDQLHWSMM